MFIKETFGNLSIGTRFHDSGYDADFVKTGINVAVVVDDMYEEGRELPFDPDENILIEEY